MAIAWGNVQSSAPSLLNHTAEEVLETTAAIEQRGLKEPCSFTPLAKV